MSSQLENNINKLEEAIFSSNFDISKFFLPDNEIAKNLMRSKNFGLSKEDADILIDGKVSDITLPGADSKNQIADYAKSNHIYPIPKLTSFYTEVNQTKTDVRKSVMLLVKSQKELVQDIVKITIQIANSIAGAAVLISPMSFNVPAAISLIMLVVDSISKLVDKMMSVIQFTDPLKKLVHVLPQINFDSITAPINLALTILISIFNAVNALKSIATGLISSLMSKIDPKNLSSQISSLEKQLSNAIQDLKGLTKIKHHKTVGTPKQILDKKNEIKELQDRLKSMKKGYNIPKMVNGEFPEHAANDFLNSIQPDLNKITTANQELLSYVYDVHLPDGTILNHIDEKKLEEIKSKYTVIFDAQNSD